VAVASAGPHANHLHLTPNRQPRQYVTTQFFTGRMPFLPPKQQRQSTEGISIQYKMEEKSIWRQCLSIRHEKWADDCPPCPTGSAANGWVTGIEGHPASKKIHATYPQTFQWRKKTQENQLIQAQLENSH